MLSLNLRVLIAASAVLAGFFGIAGATLDELYRRNAETALVERLQGQVYTLIASSQLEEDTELLHFPVDLPDTRFSTLNSGLYAEITRNDGIWSWRSASLAGHSLPFTEGLARTERDARRYTDSQGHDLYLFSYGVAWSDLPDANLSYTFSVAQDLTAYDAEISEFRHKLWGSLAGVAFLLLAVQGTILRWGLSPLKKASEDLEAIEKGTQTRLGGVYPRELQGLTSNINALLTHQQEHLERYRKSLGDLAHSLKTPLAILQNVTENHAAPETLRDTVREQVERMNQITGYQLQRAATSGWTVLTTPVNVKAVVEKVLKGLGKVYADKAVEAVCDIPADLEFHGDEGDLLEIVGNLTDNAFKWCRHRVRVCARQGQPGQRAGTAAAAVKVEPAGPAHCDFILSVEDDGPGISPEYSDAVLQRGYRGDETSSGHGIGLSIVQDIVQVYGGLLEVLPSEWGGARVSLCLRMQAR